MPTISKSVSSLVIPPLRVDFTRKRRPEDEADWREVQRWARAAELSMQQLRDAVAELQNAVEEME